METEGHPVVYAEVGEGPKTLLSYGHYDVQPPEPLDLWESDPFEPTVRDGGLYARGVADDKGDVLARIQALRLYIEEHGQLSLQAQVPHRGRGGGRQPQPRALRPLQRRSALGRRLPVGGLDERRGGAAHDLLRHQGHGLRRAARPRRLLRPAQHVRRHRPQPRLAPRPGPQDHQGRERRDYPRRPRRSGRRTLREGPGSHKPHPLRRRRAAGVLGRGGDRPRPRGPGRFARDAAQADREHRGHPVRLYGSGIEDHRAFRGVREDGLPARRGPEPRSVCWS